MNADKKVAAIRHIGFEGLGSFEWVLKARGYTVHYYDAAIHSLDALRSVDYDLVVVLGGPIGVHDEARFPFLTTELQIIEQRLQRNLPVLGVCLGAQLLAKALGARVYAGHAKEIGWGALTCPDREANPLADALSLCDGNVFHWHGDTFELPEGAKRLASSALYENQSFSYNDTAMALQFHLEFCHADLENWLIGHFHELDTAGIPLDELRRASAKHGPELIQGARRFVNSLCAAWESRSLHA